MSHIPPQQPPSSVRDYDALQKQCEAAMSELQSLKRQHDRCEKAVQESEYHRGQHRAVLAKLESTNQEVSIFFSTYGFILSFFNERKNRHNERRPHILECTQIFKKVCLFFLNLDSRTALKVWGSVHWKAAP